MRGCVESASGHTFLIGRGSCASWGSPAWSRLREEWQPHRGVCQLVVHIIPTREQHNTPSRFQPPASLRVEKCSRWRLLSSNALKPAEAEQIFVRALARKEKALGPDHTSTLLTVNNLGMLYRDQGKLAEAEQVYVRALAGYEKALGPDHTSILLTVNGEFTQSRSRATLECVNWAAILLLCCWAH